MQTGAHKAEVGAGARAGAETNSFGSATLFLTIHTESKASKNVRLLRIIYTMLKICAYVRELLFNPFTNLGIFLKLLLLYYAENLYGINGMPLFV